ncbi:TPA: hypothetical protein DEP96_01855 [Candidatus Uhrbacteria bacterium]|nr:hypothetical protein [Candidatus Uhrbacteria bacterium]
MRHQPTDEAFIRQHIAKVSSQNTTEAVYITPNHYDGGYEVRVGSLDFFVDYESIDAADTSLMDNQLTKI